MDLARENPKIAAVVGFWAALMAVGVMAACYFHFTYISRVSVRQQQTVGTVEPYEHSHRGYAIYPYKFSASKGDDYYGQSRTPHDVEYVEGETVTVFFDPKYPYTNSLTPYSEIGLPDGFVAAFAGCVALGGIIYGLVMWRRTPVRP